MDIIKYFYEEPASLEVLTPDEDPDARQQARPGLSLEDLLAAPRYYRGYLAGTDLDAGRVGLTAIAHPEAFAGPLLAWLSGDRWWCCDAQGAVRECAAAAAGAVLRNPAGVKALTLGTAPLRPDLLVAAVEPERRRALPALRELLAASHVVLFPEPAHHGFDWSLFAARPLRDGLEAAFRAHPAEDVRRFVLPYRRARSEEKFYFEFYDLAGYTAFEIV